MHIHTIQYIQCIIHTHTNSILGPRQEAKKANLSTPGKITGLTLSPIFVLFILSIHEMRRVSVHQKSDLHSLVCDSNMHLIQRYPHRHIQKCPVYTEYIGHYVTSQVNTENKPSPRILIPGSHNHRIRPLNMNRREEKNKQYQILHVRSISYIKTG